MFFAFYRSRTKLNGKVDNRLSEHLDLSSQQGGGGWTILPESPGLSGQLFKNMRTPFSVTRCCLGTLVGTKQEAAHKRCTSAVRIHLRDRNVLSVVQAIHSHWNGTWHTAVSSWHRVLTKPLFEKQDWSCSTIWTTTQKIIKDVRTEPLSKPKGKCFCGDGWDFRANCEIGRLQSKSSSSTQYQNDWLVRAVEHCTHTEKPRTRENPSARCAQRRFPPAEIDWVINKQISFCTLKKFLRQQDNWTSSTEYSCRQCGVNILISELSWWKWTKRKQHSVERVFRRLFWIHCPFRAQRVWHKVRRTNKRQYMKHPSVPKLRSRTRKVQTLQTSAWFGHNCPVRSLGKSTYKSTPSHSLSLFLIASAFKTGTACSTRWPVPQDSETVAQKVLRRKLSEDPQYSWKSLPASLCTTGNKLNRRMPTEGCIGCSRAPGCVFARPETVRLTAWGDALSHMRIQLRHFRHLFLQQLSIPQSCQCFLRNGPATGTNAVGTSPLQIHIVLKDWLLATFRLVVLHPLLPTMVLQAPKGASSHLNKLLDPPFTFEAICGQSMFLTQESPSRISRVSRHRFAQPICGHESSDSLCSAKVHFARLCLPHCKRAFCRSCFFLCWRYCLVPSLACKWRYTIQSRPPPSREASFPLHKPRQVRCCSWTVLWKRQVNDVHDVTTEKHKSCAGCCEELLEDHQCAGEIGIAVPEGLMRRGTANFVERNSPILSDTWKSDELPIRLLLNKEDNLEFSAVTESTSQCCISKDDSASICGVQRCAVVMAMFGYQFLQLFSHETCRMRSDRCWNGLWAPKQNGSCSITLSFLTTGLESRILVFVHQSTLWRQFGSILLGTTMFRLQHFETT